MKNRTPVIKQTYKDSKKDIKSFIIKNQSQKIYSTSHLINCNIDDKYTSSNMILNCTPKKNITFTPKSKINPTASHKIINNMLNNSEDKMNKSRSEKNFTGKKMSMIPVVNTNLYDETEAYRLTESFMTESDSGNEKVKIRKLSEIRKDTKSFRMISNKETLEVDTNSLNDKLNALCNDLNYYKKKQSEVVLNCEKYYFYKIV